MNKSFHWQYMVRSNQCTHLLITNQRPFSPPPDGFSFCINAVNGKMYRWNGPDWNPVLSDSKTYMLIKRHPPIRSVSNTESMLPKNWMRDVNRAMNPSFIIRFLHWITFIRKTLN